MIKRFFLLYIAVSAVLVGSTKCNAFDDERPDWLLNPTPYVAEVRFDESRQELSLTNGLAERIIRLFPNATTVSLRNLTTGEEFVRAVSPEARIVLDGESFPIGGLTDAPVANFLRDEWLSKAAPLENAYRFTRYEIGEIEERFPYKKRVEWLSRDVVWPPKGKRVSLFFQPPNKSTAPEMGETLFQEPFLERLDPSWRICASDRSPRISVVNEGKPGEIYAPADVCAYIERSWEDGAAALQVALDVGDDVRANSWGPGVALTFDDMTISVVARPHSQQYELCVNGAETLLGSFSREKDVLLSFQFKPIANNATDSLALNIEASQDGEKKTQIASFEVSNLPRTVKIGKVGKGGLGKDYANPSVEEKDFTRVHIKSATFYAPLPNEVACETRELPDVELRYEIYDGAPLISKQLVVYCGENTVDKEFSLDSFVNEELRLVETESVVDSYVPSAPYNLSVFSNYVYGGMQSPNRLNGEAFRYKIDPNYPTQVNYARQTLCLLECSPELGPMQTVAQNSPFVSNVIYEALYDNMDRERRGLVDRRVMRILAPWTAENPLMFHLVKSSPNDVREGIEQCRETGFEVLIMSFGSGFNLESKDEEYRERYRLLSEEAQSAGVALGGYSLTSSRGAATAEDNVLNPQPRYGRAPCLQSSWGQDYLQTLKDFMAAAEFGVFENDGPYPGDYCEAQTHPGHRGKEDSVWTQREAQADLYRWCRARGIYVNQPDGYFLDGGNKTGMGYRETNWSLPRAEQVVIERQNIFDGTWNKLTSQGWMFVPLSQYHGGGAAATIEPLKDHLEHYDMRFADLIGAGVQACWRGPRLYDCEETKAVVVKWVDFYKSHRRILDGDLVHLRRATARDWDGWLHVDPDPSVQTRALAFLYNPTHETIERKIAVPLYYSGLTQKALVRLGNSDLSLGEPFEVALNDQCEAFVTVAIPAESYSWIVFEKAREP